MKIRPLLTVLLAGVSLLIVAACSDSKVPESNPESAVLEPDPETQAEQEFLFEIMHENEAWGYTLQGTFIDRKGDVYVYGRRDVRWDPADRQALTRDDLLDKFNSSRRLIGHVEQPVLREMTRLIESAAEGTAERQPGYCNDYGYSWYMAYQYDGVKKVYHPVVLLLAGDAVAENQTAAARTLFSWLSRIDPRFVSPDCMP